jgi:hypothetical protein
MDPRLPSIEELSSITKFAYERIPRKLEWNYAQIMVEIIREARRLDVPGVSLNRLIYVGDTRMNDGKAFANLCAAGEWRGVAFIASETEDDERIELEEQDDRILYFANRWSALRNFDAFCEVKGFGVDEATVVVIDLDKTAIGARGRNDHVINSARVEAVRQTLVNLVGPDFSLSDFQKAYDVLNQSEFHSFTEDNQDYLAYICMILSSDLWDLSGLLGELEQERIRSFAHFLDLVEQQRETLSEPLQGIHHEILTRTRDGDPTPFKNFRRTEYLTTVGRMGALKDEAKVEEMLREEILLTAEVKQIADVWARKGALLFGLSDKPDEASVPSTEQAAQGYQPIHRTTTHVVGS